MNIYNANETIFNETTRIGVLQNYTDVLVSQEINGEYSIGFDISETSEMNYNLLLPRRIIEFDGQLYRLFSKGRKRAGITTRQVTALHIVSDASNYHIPLFPDTLGVAPRTIFLHAFAGTPFTVMTDAEILAKGLKWASTPTDIIGESKTNPLMIAKLVIEQIGYGELYIDNYKIALVEELGQDTNIELRMDLNLASIEDNENSDGIITRLYPYGKDDLTIGVVPYIDSPMMDAYGLIEGFREYGNIENPSELLTKAQFEFSPNNYHRIDIPDFSIDVSLAELSKLGVPNQEINLGDRVLITDTVFNISTTLKVVNRKQYPLNHKRGSAILGRPMKSFISKLKSDLNENQYKIIQLEKTTKETVGTITKFTHDFTEDLYGLESTFTETIYGVDGQGGITKMIENNTSSITQTAQEITTKVSKDNVISEINQSAEEIRISASKLVLDGLVTLYNLANGATTIDGGCIKTGTIDAQYISSDISQVNKNLNIGSLYDADEKLLLFSGSSLIASQGTRLRTSSEYLTLEADHIYINGLNEVAFGSKVDFTGTTVTGLNVTAKFA